MVVIGLDGIKKACAATPEAWMISIWKPRCQPAENLADTKPLNLVFADRSVPSANNQAATRADARRILEFAAQAPIERLIIHCQAGGSRSPAAAVGVGAIKAGITPGVASDEQIARAVAAPYEAATTALKLGWRFDMYLRPNEWLVALFDYELGLNGRLLRSVIDRYHRHVQLDYTWERFTEYLLHAATTDDPAVYEQLIDEYGLK